MKPERHVWEEGSTHRSVDGDLYDKVWDYAAQLEAELDDYKKHFEPQMIQLRLSREAEAEQRKTIR